MLSEKGKFVLLSSSLLFIVVAIAIGFLPYGEVGIVFLILISVVGIIGFATGVILSLTISIFLFFAVGSVVFWMLISGVEPFDNYIPLTFILIWMIAQLIVAILSGTLSIICDGMLDEMRMLRNEINNLVSVDKTTGFDNKNRLFLELENEFHRSKNYGRTFTLLLIKVNLYDQFKKLYGEEELRYLLQNLAEQLYKSTLITDQKYRIDKDTFALILADTSIDHLGLITKRLNKEMKVFRLKNNKLINLTFEYGCVEYADDINSYLDIYEMALEQVHGNA